jgi:hypothetical protein
MDFYVLITLYHYQCNTTMSMSNTTNWPICTEIEAGINLESKTSKIAYSVGYVFSMNMLYSLQWLVHVCSVYIITHFTFIFTLHKNVYRLLAHLVIMNRKKKSILYLLCSGALIYYVIQVVYFSQEYSPLQVLSDARSEARRLRVHWIN